MREKKQINVQIGNQIKLAREKAGLTQEKFAELIEMGPKNISAIERGTVGISINTVLRICDVLSITSDSILRSNTSRESDNKELQFIMERLRCLPPEQFSVVINILNGVFELSALLK